MKFFLGGGEFPPRGPSASTSRGLGNFSLGGVPPWGAFGPLRGGLRPPSGGLAIPKPPLPPTPCFTVSVSSPIVSGAPNAIIRPTMRLCLSACCSSYVANLQHLKALMYSLACMIYRQMFRTITTVRAGTSY